MSEVLDYRSNVPEPQPPANRWSQLQLSIICGSSAAVLFVLGVITFLGGGIFLLFAAIISLIAGIAFAISAMRVKKTRIAATFALLFNGVILALMWTLLRWFAGQLSGL